MTWSPSLKSVATLRGVSALCLILACGCDDAGVTGPSSNAPFIRGRVVDFRTETAMSGVVVQFASESQSDAISATTDANGSYVMPAPNTGPFTVSVDGAVAGTARVTRPTYRGDLLIDGSNCISRYGTIADGRTLTPVAGATVTLGGPSTTSGIDGWYRIDLGCRAPSFNTAFIYVTHPSYGPFQQVVGRGIHGVRRLDLHLARQ